jgi:hypothetical protein
LNTYPISIQVDANGLLRYGIKNQREKKHLLVFHTEDLQPLCVFFLSKYNSRLNLTSCWQPLCFWSHQKQDQLGQIASIPTPTSFFIPLSYNECIATSGMVGTYAIHQSSLFMKSFSDAAEDVQWKFMSQQFARLNPGRSTPHLSLAVGTKVQLHWPKSRSTFNSAKVNQIGVDIS